MDLRDLIHISLRTLAKNKLRSGLTVLGVVIGIAAVTAMVSIGQGASKLVRDEFQKIGSNVIVVLPGSNQNGGVRQFAMTTLTEGDARAISTECPAVAAATPWIATSGQIVGGDINWKPDQMAGVGVDYPHVRDWPPEAGEFFSEHDIVSAAKVCVIGHTLVKQLFPDTDPIGQTIRVKNIPFRVIGVLTRKGADLGGRDQDNVIFMPYTTVRKRLQTSAFNNVDIILVSAKSEALSGQAEMEIRGLLTERHHLLPGDPKDFEVRNTAEIASVLTVITGTLTVMLSAIAAISLVVGGVGIMNIMLVSVTERTREIGIRMALGARPRDILRQFLVEAVVLSSIGGAIGIGVGVGGSALLTLGIRALLPTSHWPFVVSVPAGIVALLFAAAVGIFFGFYPARRASRLDPIEALRYD